MPDAKAVAGEAAGDTKATRFAGAAVGFVAGLALSSLTGIIWPWLVSLVLAGVWVARGRRHARLLWLSLAFAAGAVGYIVLALLVSGDPASGSGGS
jgi:hypothetical protein